MLTSPYPATVSFGDITADPETAGFVLIVQMLADLALAHAGARGSSLGGSNAPSSEDPRRRDGDGPAAA